MKRNVGLVLIALLFGSSLALARSWENIGPEVPFVYDVVADRNHPEVWYARGSGVYRSHDYGRSWIPMPLPWVTEIAVQASTSTVYALSQTHNYWLWKSTDLGKTFQAYNPGRYLGRLFPHPRNPNLLFSTRSGGWGLAVSHDGGIHWGDVTTLPRNITDSDNEYSISGVLFSPFSDQTIYASGAYLIPWGCGYDEYPLFMVSYNSGKSWTTLERVEYKFHYDPAFPQRAFAYNKDGVKQLTRSGWVRISSANLETIVSMPGEPQKLLGVQYASWNEIKPYLKSTDGGHTWGATTLDPLKGKLAGMVALDAPSGGLIGFGDMGIFRRDDQNGWKLSNRGLSNRSGAISVASAPDGLFAIAGDTFPMRIGVNSTSWINLYLKPGFFFKDYSELTSIVIDPQNPHHMYISGWSRGGKLAESFNRGESWAKGGPYFDVIFDPLNSKNIYYLQGDPILYKSTDGGKTQTRMQIGVPNLSAVIPDPFRANKLFFISNTGVYVSTDGAQTAQKLPLDAKWPNMARTIYALPQPDSFLMGTETRKIYRTQDGGRTWNQIATAPYMISQFGAVDGTGNHLYAIGWGGSGITSYFLESMNGGITWKDISAEFDNVANNLYPWQRYFHQFTDPRKPNFAVATSAGVFVLQN